MPTLEITPVQAAAATTASQLPALAEDWIVDVRCVRKKYCRNLRRSLLYGLTDVLSAMVMRKHDTNQLREDEFWAVDDVSFTLRRGESLGLLGRNGAGKSTLLKMITGQRSLSAGTIATRGRMVALTDLGVGFNPALTGRENIYVNAAVHGFTRVRVDKILEEIIDFSGVREFIDSAVQTYSTGMKARLGFSVATHLNPDILVVDEVLAVGDLDFRRKCVRHILKYLKGGGCVIFVAHDPYLIQSICNRCMVLERGKSIFMGTGIEGVNFHFQLGHAKQFDKVSEGADPSALAPDALDLAEADQAAELAGVSGPKRRSTRDPGPNLPIVIDDMEVVSADGEELLTGNPAKVLLYYRAATDIDIAWAFTVFTGDLQTSITSCMTGLDDKIVRVKAGEGTLEALMPDFPFQAGVYALRGGIADPASGAALAAKGYEDSPHFFTVVRRQATRASNFGQIHGDLVAVKVEWL